MELISEDVARERSAYESLRRKNESEACRFIEEFVSKNTCGSFTIVESDLDA